MSEKKNVNLEEIVGLLEEATENVERVYNSGYTVGHREGYRAGYDGGYDSGQHDGYDDGRRDECDAFWQSYQQNGKRTEYSNSFGGIGWNNDNFKPRFDLKVLNGYMMFRDSAIEGHLGEILALYGLVLDVSGIYSSAYMFSFCKFSGLPAMDLSNVEVGANMFGSTSIVTIDKLIFSSKTTFHNDAFANIAGLMHLTVEGDIANNVNFAKGTKLTRDSITSIVGHLNSGVDGKTLMLSATAVNAAFPDDWDSFVTENKPAGWQITLV